MKLLHNIFTPSRRIFVGIFLLWSISFLSLFALELKNRISVGTNITPFFLKVLDEQNNLIGNSYRVFVVTPWSKTELTRKEEYWEFPKGEYRSVPQLSIVPTHGVNKTPKCKISTAIRNTQPVGWHEIELESLNSDGQISFQAAANSFPYSLPLSLLKRKYLNWGGDRVLVLQSLTVPALQTIPFLVLSLLLVLFKSTSQTTEKPQVNKSPSGLPLPNHISGLDEIRGLAILAVFLYHILYASFQFDQLGWKGNFRNWDHPTLFLLLFPLTFGHGGVAIFFAVSGFCVHLSHMRSKTQSWKEYFFKRFFRIYPPYFIALVLFTFFFPLTRVDLNEPYNQDRFLSRLFLCANFFENTYWGINGSFWSIAVESQLYLLYPVILLLVCFVGWKASLLFLLVIEILSRSSLVGSWLPPEASFALFFGPTAYIFSWAIGADLAASYLQKKRGIFSYVPFAVVFLFLTGTLFYKPLENYQFIAFAMLGIKLIEYVILYESLPMPSVFRKHLGFLGMISYSMYLLHQPFLNLAASVVKLFEPIDSYPTRIVACLLIYPIVLNLSRIFYRFIELPSIRLGQAALKGNPRTEASAASCPT